MEQNTQKSHFYFLCQKKRQDLYRPIIRWLPYRVVFVEELEQLLAYLLETPPDAVLVDVVTNMRFGSANMAPILNIEVAWPVLLCNITPDGSAQVMCMSPMKNDTLPAALEAIVRKDASWMNTRTPRRYIRVDVQCRCLLRRAGEENWTKSNILNMSSGGCFSVSYDLIVPGTMVEFELLDIKSEPVYGHGQVTWGRSWDESLALPGVGIHFDEDTAVPQEVCMFLKSKDVIDRFCEKFRQQYL
ncbi:MAG: PilZ domain-containing protein [Candidatus Omnitrophica bacterium]|nr:PilZ domain-containing protein [Candidatus Omnitrophota bacterium]